MSDTDAKAPDLSRIVGLIMENPRLIEEISSLMKKDSDAEEKPITHEAELPEITGNAAEDSPPSDTAERAQRRSRLLGALKPYLSKERARAIDSMISISEMIDLMKAR